MSTVMNPRVALLCKSASAAGALFLLGFAWTAQAQIARKPSYYDQQRETRANSFLPRPGDSRAALNPLLPSSLPALQSRADFDRLARVYDPGTPMEMPHLLFVIDQKAKPARMYYFNTPRFELHTRFIKETGLETTAGKRVMDLNYLLPNRRFLFGTLSWQQNISAFTYEFWEGDQLTAALLTRADQMVNASLYEPAKFKPNSTLHERRAVEAGVAFITQESLIGKQPYLPLNLGRAVGRVHTLNEATGVNRLGLDDIAVLRQVPLSLPPVAGVLTERPSTALSHVNLLVKGWGIPSAYVRDAASVLQAYEGQWVELTVRASGYEVRKLDAEDVKRLLAAKAAQAASRSPVTAIALPDLAATRLRPLASLRARHSTQCGAKAANLGAIMAAHIAGTEVPDGFCIPFGHYAQFMQTHRLNDRLAKMQALPGFSTDVQIRHAALASLRDDITHWSVDSTTAASWLAQWQSQLGGKGVFVRSSSNSEDLPGFSGAGLYSTVPNVKSAEALEAAVKTVWASVFNPEAWEARAAARVAPDAVVMGVLVQTAVDSVNAGVMITRDPFDANHRYVTYISAKRGIGIRVVEGQRQAEQVMYSSRSKAVQVISRSADDTALQLDPNGGVKEVALEVGRVVLTDALVLRLAAAAVSVKRLFGGVEQDIEWATAGDRIVLLQSRPYVDKRQ